MLREYNRENRGREDDGAMCEGRRKVVVEGEEEEVRRNTKPFSARDVSV